MKWKEAQKSRNTLHSGGCVRAWAEYICDTANELQYRMWLRFWFAFSVRPKNLHTHANRFGVRVCTKDCTFVRSLANRGHKCTRRTLNLISCHFSAKSLIQLRQPRGKDGKSDRTFFGTSFLGNRYCIFGKFYESQISRAIWYFLASFDVLFVEILALIYLYTFTVLAKRPHGVETKLNANSLSLQAKECECTRTTVSRSNL